MSNHLVFTSKFNQNSFPLIASNFCPNIVSNKITRTQFYTEFFVFNYRGVSYRCVFNYNRATRNYYFTEHSFINNLSLFRLKNFKINIKYMNSPKGFQDEFHSIPVLTDFLVILFKKKTFSLIL